MLKIYTIQWQKINQPNLTKWVDDQNTHCSKEEMQMTNR